MRIPAKLFFPKKWEALDRSLQKRFQEVDGKLQVALRARQRTYDELAHFTFKPTMRTKVRETIANSVRQRAQHSFTMTHEITCLRKAFQAGVYSTGKSIYQVASEVRSLLFGDTEPLRRCDMCITYHPWMRIRPPQAAEPVFGMLSLHQAGPALYGALCLYLVLLTSHPYTDGNGRTSRQMFNLHLAHAYALPPHFIPLTELTRATQGVYEEYIATACTHGDFRQLIWHLLGVLEMYAAFLQSGNQVVRQSNLARVLKLAAARHGGTAGTGVNETPPFLIAVPDMVEHESDAEVNREFLATTMSIAQALSAYGSIEFAVTGLADVASGIAPRSNAIAFFMKADRKEELILHFRELRAKYLRRVKLQVAISSGDPVVDAKILVNLVSSYASRDCEATSYPVLLHDFPATAAVERELV